MFRICFDINKNRANIGKSPHFIATTTNFISHLTLMSDLKHSGAITTIAIVIEIICTAEKDSVIG